MNYRDLAEVQGEKSAKGVFPRPDDLGRLNLLTDEVVAAAAAEIRTGRRFNLTLPLTLPDPPWSKVRRPYRHSIFNYEGLAGIQDDYVDAFYLQYSTQWDGFRHRADPRTGLFYDEVTPADAGPDGSRLGIERWADLGFAARGVLADIAGHRARSGDALDWRSLEAITVEDITTVLRVQGSELRSGDVLLVRTGFADGYRASEAQTREDVARRRDCPGLHSGEAMAEFLWDSGVTAVAADNLAVETVPPTGEGLSLHERLLPLLGVPLGELFDFGALAEDCAADGRYSCFFVAIPLNMPGAVGSPGNALAIK